MIKREWLFFVLLFLLICMVFFYPTNIYELNSYISYSTIRALIVLLLITTAFKISNIFNNIAFKLISIFNTKKSLALFFVIFTTILSMFMTNDIALFIVVPITLAIGVDINKLVIFEAISANVGSLLTPIGNPQNLYIFREWGINFIEFISKMFPLFLIEFVVLILFCFIFFSNEQLSVKLESKKVDKVLFIISLIFFILFVIALELHKVKFLLIVVFMFYFIFKKEVIKNVDYFLILTFILMFIDFKFLANIIRLDIQGFFETFYISLLSSQIISNFPATIFINRFSHEYLAILWGVNLGANGIIISSFANIIAIRMLNRGYLEYHKYALLYFTICTFLVIALLQTYFLSIL